MLLYACDALGPESVGAVAVIQLVPSALFAAVATSVADRFPRQRVLLVGYALIGFAAGITGAGMLLGWPPAAVIAAAVFTSCALSIPRPAHWALLPALARTPEELTTANGVAGSVEGIGSLLGPLGAAAVLTFGPPGAVFVAGAVAAMASAVLVLALPVDGDVHLAHAHDPGEPAADHEHPPRGRRSRRGPGHLDEDP